MEAQQTPFSPCSFDYFPGSPENNSEAKTFRFAGAPDGPLPSIPDESPNDSEHEEIVVVPRTTNSRMPKIATETKTCKDFPALCLFATAFCTIGSITYAVAIHKVLFLWQIGKPRLV